MDNFELRYFFRLDTKSTPHHENEHDPVSNLSARRLSFENDDHFDDSGIIYSPDQVPTSSQSNETNYRLRRNRTEVSYVGDDVVDDANG